MLKVRVRKNQGEFSIQAGFTIEDSGVTALFGYSGAGKTSIVNMVAGLSAPDSGVIEMNGRKLFDSEQGINLPPEQRRVGYVFQDARLFPHLTVKGNLIFGMKLAPKGSLYVDFDEVVDMLGIGPLLSRRPARLSGGEKQRVAIGRALLCSPSLLLMDEPLASLDENRKSEVLPFISRLSQGFSIPILYVSHMLSEIEKLADNLVLLENGGVAASGPFEALKSSRTLAEMRGGGESRGALHALNIKLAS
ncbi:molybdate transport system ATP-binding protein [Desulfatibacillum alkenivorans DSM 16219]|jgi:molybdate transport system ATP-binding protein|uniref:Molybdate transport system ATP-binding protein n=1 Tax=Desulfatibacillum alkenivorans DSM 16219 TaxID=1121393 RepID=A0A1M6JM30_9BACT|nr:molybdenum ABC transporter ATP-binding protein [Desulfatibacillum alkenivorans]SHJ47713.1 molybdate transport system ATP-binding protein [Desulfatibacillum alkenivorans DSM 16219]